MGAPDRKMATSNMNELSTHQIELDFGIDRDESGFNQWRLQREQEVRQLSAQIGFPLGHQVEVWLRGGIRLRGCLQLREHGLFIQDKPGHALELVVDGVPFVPTDIESCVRL
jgi:hypothetical protein